MKISSILFILIGAMFPLSAASQVTWTAECVNLSPQFPPFMVLFTSTKAFVALKGWKYELPYYDSGVDVNGNHWSIYRNNSLNVATTYPNKLFVRLERHPFRSDNQDLISQGFCN